MPHIPHRGCLACRRVELDQFTSKSAGGQSWSVSIEARSTKMSRNPATMLIDFRGKRSFWSSIMWSFMTFRRGLHRAGNLILGKARSSIVSTELKPCSATSVVYRSWPDWSCHLRVCNWPSRRTGRIEELLQRPDCLAGHVRLELGNVVANYPFERSYRFRLLHVRPAAK